MIVKRLVRVVKRQGLFRVGDIICTGENTAALYVAGGWAVFEDEQNAVILETRRRTADNVWWKTKV